MSTVFAIFKTPPKTDGHGELLEEDFEIEHIEIARRGNRTGIHFKIEYEPLIVHLDDKVEVFALDNTAQGIYTIGDIRKEINEQHEKSKNN